MPHKMWEELRERDAPEVERIDPLKGHYLLDEGDELGALVAADEMIHAAKTIESDHWNEDDLLHNGHTVRGTLFLRRGDVRAAASELLAAAAAPDTSGRPDVELALALVEAGQDEAVLTYLRAIAARRHSPGVRGRPLGPRRAWQEILAGPIDLRRPGRYQRRANIIRCDMSRADAGALPAMVGALIGGVRAAVDLGEQLALDDSVDLYLPAESFRGLDARVAFVPDATGRVALRVVDDDAWQLIPKGAVAPRNAVALDLLESGDPRRWIAGEHVGDSNG